MTTYKQLTEADKGMIVGLKIDERSDRDIGKILGRHHQTISHWYNRYQSSGQSENSPSGHRPEKLSKREKHASKFYVAVILLYLSER